MKFLHEFLEYGDGTFIDNGWWEIRGDKLINGAGGWHPYTPTDNDIIVEAEGRDELDYSYLLQPDSDLGWLNLDGKFYGCKYRDHQALAELYFKTSERRLEEMGWIKIFKDFDGDIAWYHEEERPTKKQEDYLLEKGLMRNYEKF